MPQQTPRKYWHLITSLILGFGLILGMAFIVSAQVNTEPQTPQITNGTTITVTTTDDELNGDGDCSLREAVQAANTDATVSGCDAGSGWDTIIVPAGTYILTLVGIDEDNNLTGDLDILESVTIQGDGAIATTIDGNATDRVFHTDPTNQGVAFELQNVSVTNGAADMGGALRQERGA